MKLIFSLCLFFMASVLYAQNTFDVVYLKDGSFYKGNITEYVPGGHLTIQLLDGRLITVQSENIESATTGHKTLVKKKLNIKEKGYFHNSLVGPQFGKGRYNTEISFAYHMINGYRINGHHPGVGLGLENYLNYWYAPVYVEYAYRFLKGRFSPYIGVNGGYMAALQKDQDMYGIHNYSKGTTVGVRLGFSSYSNDNFGFIVNVGYRYIQLTGSESTSYIRGGSYAIVNSAELPRLNFMVGFLFN